MHEDINYFISNSDDDKRPLSLEISGISYCDGSYHINRKKSRVLVLEYIEKGTGTVIFDGVEYTCSEGDIYILKQDHRHEYFSDADDPWVKIFFNIKGRLCEELLNAYAINDFVVIRDCFELKPLFDEMYELTCNRDQKMMDEIFAEFSLLYHKLIIEISKKLNYENLPSGEIYNLKNYIDNNAGRIVSNTELAKMIFRSNDYVVKKFKDKFGVTPYDYQIQLKISVAKRLLIDTVLPISIISEKLGYSDQHYFSNLFRQKCGISPLNYRKSKK